MALPGYQPAICMVILGKITKHIITVAGVSAEFELGTSQIPVGFTSFPILMQWFINN